MTDIRIVNHGSLYALWGITKTGCDWLEANLDPDAPRWTSRAWMVEPRYVAPIVQGALDDGLEVV